MARRPNPRNSRGYHSRLVDEREPLPRFLIVCEGEKTEPNYFLSFRVPRRVIDVRGEGYNTVSLVERAIEIRDEDDYDEVWVVFDRDSFPPRNFNAAFSLADRNSIQVAYSNEAFELWYVLHFEYLNTGISRAQYITKLHKLLGHKYEKNSTDIYRELADRVPIAIKYAKKLLSIYEPLRPEKANPSTTVHVLVEKLLQFEK